MIIKPRVLSKGEIMKKNYSNIGHTVLLEGSIRTDHPWENLFSNLKGVNWYGSDMSHTLELNIGFSSIKCLKTVSKTYYRSYLR